MSGSYFGGASGSRGRLRIVPRAELRSFEVAAGISIEPVVGERLNINVVTLAPGAIAELHAHDEEQIGYVVSGSMQFTDGSETWSLGAGDTYHAASGARHGARAGAEGCVVLDAFAPPRSGVRELLEG